MNAKRCLLIAAAALVCAGAARADDWVAYDPAGPEAFPGNQLNLDVFGTYADRDRFGNHLDRGGSGVGLDYFFCPYFGLGAETYVQEWRRPYRAIGDAIVRLPLQQGGVGFAVYAIGGGGREFKYVEQWSTDAGAGVEFKFNRHMGIFGDARRVFPERTPNYTLARAGFRIGF